MAAKPNSARSDEQQYGHTDLRVPDTLLSDEALRFIIDEWLIPAMLEDFLRTKILHPEVE
jgi:hypothetical protein